MRSSNSHRRYRRWRSLTLAISVAAVLGGSVTTAASAQAHPPAVHAHPTPQHHPPEHLVYGHKVA